MATRFNIYFGDEEEALLEEGKKKIDNLSSFFKAALKARLEEGAAEPEIDYAGIFQKKFGDFATEAAVYRVFEDRTAAKQALKNRLLELKRAYPSAFPVLAAMFCARFPAYAGVMKEL